MKNNIFYIISLCILTLSNIEAQEYNPLPSDLRCETNVTEPLNLRKGYLRTSLDFAFAPQDSYFNGFSRSTRLISFNNNMHLSGYSSYFDYVGLNVAYGITNKLQISFNLPYYYGVDNRLITIEYVPWNQISNDKIYQYENGFDNSSLSLTYQFLNKKDFFSAFALGIDLPTGSKKTDTINVNDNYTKIRQPVSSDAYYIDLAFLIKKVNYPYYFSILPIYSLTTEDDYWKAYSTLSLSASCGYLLNSWFSINGSLKGNYTPNMISKTIELENKNIYAVLAGISIIQQVKRFRFYEKMFIPMAGKKMYPSNMNIMFSVSYTL